MLGIEIKRLFDKLAGRQGQMSFIRYAVNEVSTANSLRRWMDSQRDADTAINNHLKGIVPVRMRINELHYMTDLDGRLCAITVSGPVPHGWTGVEHLSLLRPESEAAVAAIELLPKSSRRDLHEMISWPTFGNDYVSHQHPELARQFNHATRVDEVNGQIFVAVPDHAFTKDVYPYIYAEIERWTQEQKNLTRADRMPAGYNRPFI